MTTSRVVLDANVLVGQFDRGDSLHARARGLLARLHESEAEPVLLDFVVAEAVSVLSRRAKERKANPPDLAMIVASFRARTELGHVVFVPSTKEQFARALAVVEECGGALNFNDARLVVMQREGHIGAVASFDAGLDAAVGFERIEWRAEP
jgi:predicted nucleic acid-binding protein